MQCPFVRVQASAKCPELNCPADISLRFAKYVLPLGTYSNVVGLVNFEFELGLIMAINNWDLIL